MIKMNHPNSEEPINVLPQKLDEMIDKGYVVIPKPLKKTASKKLDKLRKKEAK